MKANDNYRDFPNLSNEELQNLWRLVQMAISQKYGKTVKKNGGMDIETLFMDALADAYTGKRRYPIADRRGNKVSIYKFILNVVKSKLSHLAERGKKLPCLYIDEILQNPRTETYNLFLQNTTTLPDHDDQIYRAELYSRLEEKVRPDTDLSTFLKVKMHNPDIEVKEIAEITGWSEKKVRALSGRLNLEAQALKKELERQKKTG